MDKYLEKQMKLLKDFSTPELRKSIVDLECFLVDFPKTGEYGFVEYLEHLKCEYAERIGK